MKLWIAALLIVLGVGAGDPAWAGANRKTAHLFANAMNTPPPHLRMQRNQRILTREEVEAVLTPHQPSISNCYKRHASKQEGANGIVQLEMLIRPEGKVHRLWVRARGVRGTGLRNCVAELAGSWVFPKKFGYTNAVVRFYFPISEGDDEGKADDCWSASGCLAQFQRPSRWHS
jgi:hypothetical protein